MKYRKESKESKKSKKSDSKEVDDDFQVNKLIFNSNQSNQKTSCFNNIYSYQINRHNDCGNIINENIQNKYILEKLIGKGSFGSVYLGFHIKTKINFALKRFFKTLHPNIIKMEILLSKYVSDIKKNQLKNDKLKSKYDQFLRLEDIIIRKSRISDLPVQKEIFIIYEYFPHHKFQDYFTRVGKDCIKHYLYNLLNALSFLHENNLIHRDIKPDNFLFNFLTFDSRLIDYGLIEIDYSKKPINNQLFKQIEEIQSRHKLYNRIGTRGFLAPEVILNIKDQSDKIDIWSVGCIFLSFLTWKIQFFYMNSNTLDDNLKELIPLIIIFGDKKIKELCNKYNYYIYFPELLKTNTVDDGFYNKNIYKRADIDEIFSEGGIDLLEKLLELDPQKRISSKNALEHKFFDSIR